ncbi:conserved hypothetical protein [Coccidioides posadasii str. Silveira]|uniref:Uncharacterized protein n=1 Tax=Coccidioides posadasii (strain RMSCC 757 / Silveira) TaxID=443226 RepID=E9CS97_COCPS|nr:conserved hypothetical protein [Coccidioides posadasii str. Silveira]
MNLKLLIGLVCEVGPGPFPNDCWKHEAQTNLTRGRTRSLPSRSSALSIIDTGKDRQRRRALSNLWLSRLRLGAGLVTETTLSDCLVIRHSKDMAL